jgi:hypothetical protein
MNKAILRTIIIVFCAAAFGAGSNVFGSDTEKPLDLSPPPEKIVLSMQGVEYMYSPVSTPAKDYLTEQFESTQDAFDLAYHSVTFVPTPDGTSYGVEVELISELPTDPAKGIDLELGDDAHKFVKLNDLVAVSIYGASFTGLYVGSNGYITFTEGDKDYSESLEDHFRILRVSGLFRDLDPSSAGQVTYKQLADRIAVTWVDVPEYGSSNSSTFQIEMFFDGDIRLSWLDIGAERGIVGLSDGLGIQPGFQETDFSELYMPPTADDYLTEQFSDVNDDDFDLSYASVTFYPALGGTSYIGVLEDISELPTNPFGGTDLELRDDNYAWVGLSYSAEVVIFNQSFPTFYVGANGYITFTQPDTDHSETLAEHFETLRISGLYTDLTVVNEGSVTAIQFVDRVSVTWEDAPEFSNTMPNTFQIEMFYDGRIRISWLDIGSPSNIVGLSNGLGLSPDFVETDFSVDYAPKP